MAFTQDFRTQRRNHDDGETRIGEKDRLWYDSNTNTIRISDGETPGGVVVGGAGGGGDYTLPTASTSVKGGVKVDGTTITINNQIISAVQQDLSSYATQTYVTTRGYLTSVGTISYNDLSNKPTLFSGSYTDLTDKPTIPSLTGYATETFVTTRGYLTTVGTISYTDLSNKPTLFSGSYNDLSDKPNLAGTYTFNVAADDSTMREISSEETVKFVGAGGITTASDAEGKITITQGTTSSLVNGANTVSLDANGNLTFPQGTLLGYSDPGGFIINGAVDKDIAIYTYNGADAHGWTFGTDGSLTLPGDIRSEGNINIDINLSDSTLRRWQFGEDGALTLPSGGTILNSSGQPYVNGVSSINTSVTTSIFTDASGDYQYGTLSYDYAVNGVSNSFSIEYSRPLVGGNVDINVGNTIVNGDLTLSGDIKSNGNINIDINLSDSTLRRWQFGEDGGLTFPDGYLKIVPNGANPYISNIIDNGLGLVSGSGIQIRQSVADAYGISINSSTTDTSLGDGSLLASGSNIDVNGSKIILGQYVVNNLDADTGLTGQNKIEINNSAILIGLDVSTLTNGTTTSAFSGWTFNGQANTLTLPGGGTIAEVGPFGVLQITPRGGANAYQALWIYPKGDDDGDHIHLTAGGGSTELYLGNDLQYVKLASSGVVRIQADNGVNSAAWQFGTDGGLTFPDSTVQTTAWTGFSVAADDSTQRSISSGELVKFIGAGGITTASDAEGTITITQGAAAAGTLTGSTLASGVTASSLTSVGTLTSLTVNSSSSTAVSITADGRPGSETNSWSFVSNQSIGGPNAWIQFPDTTLQTTAWTGTAAAGTLTGSTLNSTVVSSSLTSIGTLTGLAVTTTTTSNAATVTYNPSAVAGYAIQATGKDTQGGIGYFDFLKATNTTSGATNPNKSFRLNSTGGIEIINSAYSATLLTLTDAGAFSVASTMSSTGFYVNNKQAVNGPAFRAYIDGSQTISSGSQQKVTFGAETFDTNANFATSRFTPNVEGYYQLNATVRISGPSSTGEIMLTIWKNGSEYARGTNENGTEQGASFYSMQVSDIAYANGTGDYFEIYIQQVSGSNRDTTAGSNISYFSGSMIRGA